MSISQRKKIYRRALDLFFLSQAKHIGSSLSCLDILIVTLAYIKRDEDIFILSKGHAAPALYVVLNSLEKISDRELMTFHRDGTRLPAHPPNYHFKDLIHFPTGSLGHGLSLCCGIAQAMKLSVTHQKKNPFVYCLMSDGECNEGQVWEAAQYASAKRLDNLVALIDRNGIQAFGRTKDVLGDAASKEKWQAFGFEVFECHGHNHVEMKNIFKKVRTSRQNKPKVIIFKTVKGHGVSFMENTIQWHYLTLSEEQYKQAVEDIRKNL
jgi:transketolase